MEQKRNKSDNFLLDGKKLYDKDLHGSSCFGYCSLPKHMYSKVIFLEM